MGILVALAMSAAVSPATAQEPTCVNCPGTLIPNSEIEQYIKRGFANDLTDQQIRQVSVGKSNVGIAVVTRKRVTTANVVAEHDLVSEVYHVISGAGTIELGPDLVGKERRNPNDNTVRLLNGPGNNAIYTIVHWAGIRIVDVKLTGSMNSKRVIIQPCPMVLPGVIPSSSDTSDYVYSPVVLVK